MAIPKLDFGRLREIKDPNRRAAFERWLKTDPEALSHPYPIRVEGLPLKYCDFYWMVDMKRWSDAEIAAIFRAAYKKDQRKKRNKR